MLPMAAACDLLRNCSEAVNFCNLYRRTNKLDARTIDIENPILIGFGA